MQAVSRYDIHYIAMVITPSLQINRTIMHYVSCWNKRTINKTKRSDLKWFWFCKQNDIRKIKNWFQFVKWNTP